MSTMAPPLPTGFRTQVPSGETRIVVRGVPWRTYELWVDSLPARSGVRMAYDGEDLEIMTKSRTHESYSGLFGRLVDVVTEELEIPCSSNRETTWKRPEVSRGLEADQSYYFRPEKLAAAAAAKVAPL